jgi:lysophospholipase L1-like esterase
MPDQKWTGLGWGTLGDSITEAGGYQPLVAEALGFGRVVNYGKGGCPMTAGGDRDYGATVNISETVDPTLECVTVFAGVNDFRLHQPIGQLGSKDIYTFYGAYETTVERILTANPSCRLSLWTPLHRDKDGFDIDTVNEAGHRLGDYAEAVRQIGMRYALPVLDLYSESGFNRLTLPTFTYDGLHPSEAGHQRIAGMAISFLQRL